MDKNLSPLLRLWKVCRISSSTQCHSTRHNIAFACSVLRGVAWLARCLTLECCLWPLAWSSSSALRSKFRCSVLRDDATLDWLLVTKYSHLCDAATLDWLWMITSSRLQGVVTLDWSWTVGCSLLRSVSLGYSDNDQWNAHFCVFLLCFAWHIIEMLCTAWYCCACPMCDDVTSNLD